MCVSTLCTVATRLVQRDAKGDPVGPIWRDMDVRSHPPASQNEVPGYTKEELLPPNTQKVTSLETKASTAKTDTPEPRETVNNLPPESDGRLPRLSMREHRRNGFWHVDKRRCSGDFNASWDSNFCTPTGMTWHERIRPRHEHCDRYEYVSLLF
jgi:hypothetical protein